MTALTLHRKEVILSPNEQYYLDLLTDVRALLSSHEHDDRKLRQQLECLLNRKGPDDTQPFAKNKQPVDWS
ncbi:hypothetical protein RIMD111065_20930 [Aeromonas hydrophila]|nr:hypothetical protein RIMD111065_20930 [Aeromonas hydrophila]